MGATRSWASIRLSHVFGVQLTNTTYTSNLKIINGAFIGAIALPALSLFMSYKEWYEVTRETLIQKIAKKEAGHDLDEKEDKALRDDISQISSEVNKVLYEAQAAFDSASALDANDNWQYLSELLRRTATEVIRPLSHTLHNTQIGRAKKRISWVNYIPGNNIFPLYISLLYGLTTFRGISIKLPFPTSLLNFLIKIALIYIFAYLFKNFLSDLRMKNKYSQYLQLLLSLVTALVDYSTNLTFEFTASILNFAWLLVLIVATSFFAHFLKFYRNEEMILRHILSEDRTITGSGDLQRRTTYKNIAKYLHAVVQSRLMASAIALEIAGRSGDHEKLSMQIAQARGYLHLDLLNMETQSVISIDDLSEVIKNSWGSLININFDINISGNPSENLLLNLKQFADEAISNAFRHGLASEITIQIVSSLEGLEIKIIDNGLGFEKLEGGLGMEYFNLIAPGNWKLLNNPDQRGAILFAQIKEVPFAKA